MKWFYTPFPFLFFLLTSTSVAGIQNNIDDDNKVGFAETLHALKTALTNISRAFQ